MVPSHLRLVVPSKRPHKGQTQAAHTYPSLVADEGAVSTTLNRSSHDGFLCLMHPLPTGHHHDPLQPLIILVSLLRLHAPILHRFRLADLTGKGISQRLQFLQLWSGGHAAEQSLILLPSANALCKVGASKSVVRLRKRDFTRRQLIVSVKVRGDIDQTERSSECFVFSRGESPLLPIQPRILSEKSILMTIPNR